jgi:hypothetical protein
MSVEATVIVLCGFLLIERGSVGFIRSNQTTAGSNPVILRAVPIGGAVLYISRTVLQLIL